MEDDCGSCAACGGERGLPHFCTLCGASLCDGCVCECGHHGCGISVCQGCCGLWTPTYCIKCEEFVCPRCDEWVADGVGRCGCCPAAGCERCMPLFWCEVCRCPACTECGGMLDGTREWYCSGCENEKKVYSENLDLNSHGYADLYPLAFQSTS